MILLIDNYDSFVHNLARYFHRLGQETAILRNDVVTAADVRGLSPQAIVISPGPCTPSEAGHSVAIIRDLYERIPMLGVCLGHQAIAAAFGCRIVRANEPVHGRTSPVIHQGAGLFHGLPTPFTVCRYHSLVVEESSLPSKLIATARTADGTIMALQHSEYPVFGLQFHPEATLTQHGFRLLGNFLHLAGVYFDREVDSVAASEFSYARMTDVELPARPVTF